MVFLFWFVVLCFSFFFLFSPVNKSKLNLKFASFLRCLTYIVVSISINRPWSQKKALSCTSHILHQIEQAEVCHNEVLMLVSTEFGLFPQKFGDEERNKINNVKYHAYWVYSANRRKKCTPLIQSVLFDILKNPKNSTSKMRECYFTQNFFKSG